MQKGQENANTKRIQCIQDMQKKKKCQKWTDEKFVNSNH